MTPTMRPILLLAITLTIAAPSGTAVPTANAQRPGTGQEPSADAGRRVEGRSGVVTSANPLASEAGVAILRAGGNAVDAAVAAAFAIGVVEPQMSGLGGSGAATVWFKRDRKPAYLDFYASQPVDAWRGRTEPAPRGGRGAGAPPQPTGEETTQPAALGSPDLRIVGIPGEVAGLLALHEKYGVLTRDQVMAPAIRLAEEGFPVGQILAGFIVSAGAKMKASPEAMALYFPAGRPLAPGETLKNPALADSLRHIARDGRKGFYEGPTADAVLKALNAGRHPARPADLAGYQPQWKRPLCTDYRGATVLSAPPPQTGLQILHTLELLESYDLKKMGLPTQSAAAFDVLVSAMRVAQTAARANSDPDWVAVPANGISSAAFAAARRPLVGARPAMPSIDPADAKTFDTAPPAGECARYDPYGPATSVPGSESGQRPAERGERSAESDGETTHLSVVDKDGNAVALTQTNSSVWGSGGFAAGFFLNDSGFRFTDENIGAASRRPWRTRTTTIAPTIVLRKGEVQMVVGAPGAGRIPTEIAQVMVYTLDYGLDPLEAVRMPRIFPSAASTRVQIEHGFTPDLLRDVRALGYDPAAESAGYARLYLIVRRGNTWIGVADPRHDGQPRAY